MNDNYQFKLKHHLANYAREQLKLDRSGTWKGKFYPHILPIEQAQLNFLPACRTDLQEYLKINPRIRLHQYFHHLSSSQAFALNLFHPFFQAGLPAAESFFAAFGPIRPSQWNFEVEPDSAEGTNVDVVWKDDEGSALYCEVKLSESEFGTAKNDDRHMSKLETIYRPRLVNLVPTAFLEPVFFFRHYQILRNVSLLHNGPLDRVVFLIPQANRRLIPALKRVLDGIGPATRAKIHVVHIESTLAKVIADPDTTPELRAHAAAVIAKYVPNIAGGPIA